MINFLYGIVFLVFASISYLFYVHMFQLNSYFNSRFCTWIKKNYFNKSPILFRNKDKKISLKFTDRVKRLTATFIIIYIFLMGICLYFFNQYALIIALIVLYFLIPLVIMVSNIINKPVETMINQKFYNEAKSILENHKDLIVIGITGSFGKTSVKHFLTSLLQSEYETLMTPGNFNTTMGVIRTVREYLKPTHEIFVCEMGAKKLNDIKEITDLVNPQIGIITSIGQQHLETFKSVDNIIKTKFELADAVKEEGVVFLNFDNEYIKNKEISQEYKSYSINGDTSYVVSDIRFEDDGTTFLFKTFDGLEQEYNTNLIGIHNILNIACCVGVCHHLGIELKKLVPYVKKLESVPHRLELKQSGKLTIIDDAYNSNPLGAKMALDSLSNYSGRKVIITPGMVELGEEEYNLNYELGKYCKGKADEVCLVGKKQTEPIYNGLIDGKFDNNNIKIFSTFNEAFSYVRGLSNEYEKVCVLLENDLPDSF